MCTYPIWLHLAVKSRPHVSEVQKPLKICFLSDRGASFLHLLRRAQPTGGKTNSPLPGGSANKPLRCLAVKRCADKGERQVPRGRGRSLRQPLPGGHYPFSRHNGQPTAPGAGSIGDTPIWGPCARQPRKVPTTATPAAPAHIWRLQLCPRLRAPRRGGRGSPHTHRGRESPLAIGATAPRSRPRGGRTASPLAALAGGASRLAAAAPWAGPRLHREVREGPAAAAGSGSAGEKPRRAMA